jgi:hypothetical protein
VNVESSTNLKFDGFTRFLADRFVEGVCPRCGYDVSAASPASTLQGLKTISLAIRRTLEVTSVISAPGPFHRLPNFCNLDASVIRTTRSLPNPRPILACD